MTNNKQSKYEPLVLAREVGIYDEYEKRLEEWLFDECPDLHEDKEYIIMKAMKAREMSKDKSRMYPESDASTYLIEGVSRSVFDECKHAVDYELNCFDGKLHYMYIRSLAYKLSKEQRVLDLIKSIGGLEELDYDVYVEDEFREIQMPALVKEIVEDWGGVEALYPYPTEKQIKHHEELRSLRREDYRAYFNLLEYTLAHTRYLSSLWDAQRERGEELAPYFTYTNEHGKLEEVRVIPDWAVDRYFDGNPEMKEAFAKYADELRAHFEPIEEAYIADRTEVMKKFLEENGACYCNNEYNITVELYDDKGDND